MMRYSIYLVAVLVPACMVDTPVVEGEKARLGEDLGAWCESLCDTAFDCGASDAPESCPDDCVAYFTETYVGKGDVCERAALRLMDCWEDASCSELIDDNCNAAEEAARCAESLGQVVCQAEDTGVGVDGSPFECDLGFSDCSDGKEYRLSCLQPGDPPDCHCSIDGTITGSFTPNLLSCPSSLEAKQICGWPIPNGWGEPESPGPATCMTFGSTGTGAPDDCEIMFGHCSDGHEYGIQCGGPAGAGSCRCELDGAPIGFVGSPEAICPFAHDLDNGAVTLNYACGFKLAPPSGLLE